MSNMKDKSAKTKQMMDNLQNELDYAVFEQEEMDPEKVQEILAKMENIDPEADEVKAEFDKDFVWKRIQEQCREEMAEESTIDFEAAKKSAEKTKVQKDASNNSKSGKKNSSKVRRIALTAATIVVAVFVGANIGTYATERKSVIEYVQELGNGMEFFVNDDVSSLEMEQNVEVYYSWNDVPSEYKKFLVIPKGMPEDMGLYDIEVTQKDTVAETVVRYIDAEAQKDFIIQIMANKNDEFTLANLIYEENYKLLKKQNIESIEVYFYTLDDNEIIVQFIFEEYIYTVSGTLSQEQMQVIIEKTIESNF